MFKSGNYRMRSVDACRQFMASIPKCSQEEIKEKLK